MEFNSINNKNCNFRKICYILEDMSLYPILISLFSGMIGSIIISYENLSWNNILKGFIIFAWGTIIMYIILVFLIVRLSNNIFLCY